MADAQALVEWMFVLSAAYGLPVEMAAGERMTLARIADADRAWFDEHVTPLAR